MTCLADEFDTNEARAEGWSHVIYYCCPATGTLTTQRSQRNTQQVGHCNAYEVGACGVAQLHWAMATEVSCVCCVYVWMQINAQDHYTSVGARKSNAQTKGLPKSVAQGRSGHTEWYEVSPTAVNTYWRNIPNHGIEGGTASTRDPKTTCTCYSYDLTNGNHGNCQHGLPAFISVADEVEQQQRQHTEERQDVSELASQQAAQGYVAGNDALDIDFWNPRFNDWGAAANEAFHNKYDTLQGGQRQSSYPSKSIASRIASQRKSHSSGSRARKNTGYKQDYLKLKPYKAGVRKPRKFGKKTVPPYRGTHSYVRHLRSGHFQRPINGGPQPIMIH